jgi:hypothetical protein
VRDRHQLDALVGEVRRDRGLGRDADEERAQAGGGVVEQRLGPSARARPCSRASRQAVQVVLETGKPVLRAGEALLAERGAITGWRNLGQSEATLFWVLRDQ